MGADNACVPIGPVDHCRIERFPVICMDESPRQLIGEVKTPIPVAPGRPARHDYEYKRHGVCNVFMANEPLAGIGSHTAHGGSRPASLSLMRGKPERSSSISRLSPVAHSPRSAFDVSGTAPRAASTAARLP